jgi:nickel-dependent lactate racemase
MKLVFAKTLLAASLFLPGIASAEMIDMNSSGGSQVTIIRGAPERCGLSGPLIIRVQDVHRAKPVRCATPIGYENNNSGVQVNNLVVVFLASDRHRHYQRHR